MQCRHFSASLGCFQQQQDSNVPPPTHYLSSSDTNSSVIQQHPFQVAPNPLNPLQGIASKPFDARIAQILQAPVAPLDVEVKPDGILYLPEIKYRRILNDAFGPGGWALLPRGAPKKTQTIIFQEFALYAGGRFVAQAYGEQALVSVQNRSIATAYEGAKSNALMRCCKDLGVASELWDPEFITNFKPKYLVRKFVKNVKTNQTSRLWRRKDRPAFSYPFEEQDDIV
eukprot:CAMPEP_0117438736 /NCGR_PEP_ID=MMETSP0759-20121206/2207_1 /TAXON_ID=63605 /ORGANISM="Percolomonas cosmopolitus, Strain WS" /LENGTH=226 /DNA_ID=CAMNT_0005230437 /DNA_START=187 /DNA_END=864 /DNA_ORIENTATION=+